MAGSRLKGPACLAAVTVGHYPCTLAIAREIGNGDAANQNRLITQEKDYAQLQP